MKGEEKGRRSVRSWLISGGEERWEGEWAGKRGGVGEAGGGRKGE